MVINYLDVEVKYAKTGKVEQSIKLNEWARNDFKKNRGNKFETNGIK